MATVKVKYVGLKVDGERAFKELTGITWMPGDVKDVEEAHAKQMLRHGDVFAQAAGEAVKPSKDTPMLKMVSGDQDEVDDEAIAREAAAKKAKEDAAAAKAAEKAAKAEAAKKDEAPAKKVAAKKSPAKKK